MAQIAGELLLLASGFLCGYGGFNGGTLRVWEVLICGLLLIAASLLLDRHSTHRSEEQ